MSSAPILVFGATGRVGGQVYRQLAALNVPVRAAVRDTTKAAKVLPNGAAVIRADLTDPSSVANAVKESKAESVFIYAIRGGMADVITSFKAANVQHVVLLSSNAVGNEHVDQQNVIVQLHAQVESNIRQSGMTYTFVRSGGFAANVFNWKHSIAHGGIVKSPYPEASQALLAEEDTAAVVVTALTTHQLDNQYVRLVGPRAFTQREEVAIISRVLGKPIEIIRITEDEFRESSKMIPPGVVDVLLNMWKRNSERVDDTSASANILKYTGRPGIPFDSYIEQHKREFEL